MAPGAVSSLSPIEGDKGRGVIVQEWFCGESGEAKTGGAGLLCVKPFGEGGGSLFQIIAKDQVVIS